MWSIALIVGVAVASGMVVLVVGISFAILIERRRHYRILRAHGIGINTNIRTRRSSYQHNGRRDKSSQSGSWRSSIGFAAAEPGTWSHATLEEDLRSNSTPGYGHNVGQALTSVKRVSRLTKRLDRIHSLRHPKSAKSVKQVISSPLSAITEISGTSCTSPRQRDAPSLANEKDVSGNAMRRSPVPWVLPVSKTRVNNNAVGCATSSQSDRRTSIAELSCFQSTISAATDPPVDPLPPLPSTELNRQRASYIQHASTTSVDTVDSSVLESQSSPVHKGISKTHSQAWHDFDFGLGLTTMKIGSPARQLRRGAFDERDVVNSLRASLSVCETPLPGNLLHIKQRSRDCDPSSGPTGNPMTGPAGRHSMFVGTMEPENHERQSLQVSPRIHQSLLGTTMLPRPRSAITRQKLVWDPASDSQCYKNILNPAIIPRKGHKRQNCVHISGIPLLESKSVQQSQMPRLSEEDDDTLEAHSGQHPEELSTIRATADAQSPWPKPLSLKRTSATSDASRPTSDIFYQSQPATPRITLGWSMDQTPTNALVSPCRIESPTLPSPAYTSAGLFPRKSLVQGPRRPRTDSPLGRSASCAKRKLPSNDLRRSVMRLRSITPQGRLLAKREVEDRSSVDDKTTLLQPTDDRERSHSTQSSASSLPSTPREKITISRSTVSIWEDASVHGDSPEPELPNSSLMPGSRPLSTSLEIKPADDERRERSNWDKSLSTVVNRENVNPIGLGLSLDRHMETPGSLYDRDGFLKE